MLASDAIVLRPAHTLLEDRASSIPASPPATSSRASVFVSIENTTSTDSASSRGCPPSACRHRAAAAREPSSGSSQRRHSRRRATAAIPAPIAPIPAKPTRAMSANIARRYTQRPDARAHRHTAFRLERSPARASASAASAGCSRAPRSTSPRSRRSRDRGLPHHHDERDPGGAPRRHLRRLRRRRLHRGQPSDAATGRDANRLLMP